MKEKKDTVADQVQELEARRDADMEKARKQIEKAIDVMGQFSHNIATLVLQDISKKWGYRYANDLCREFDLSEVFGIEELKGEK